jgi:hypothetical protein
MSKVLEKQKRVLVWITTTSSPKLFGSANAAITFALVVDQMFALTANIEWGS